MINELPNKNKWTEKDFEDMEWHDNFIHAISFGTSNKLLFDIDHIVKWIKPMEGENFFRFWVAPSTLIFKNVYNLKIESTSLNLIIQNIQRENPRTPQNINSISETLEYEWLIETNDGEIEFISVGYEQHLRQNPVLLDSQKIELSNRGGIFFI